MRRCIWWKIRDLLIDHVIPILERPVLPKMSLPKFITVYWAKREGASEYHTYRWPRYW